MPQVPGSMPDKEKGPSPVNEGAAASLWCAPDGPVSGMRWEWVRGGEVSDLP